MPVSSIRTDEEAFNQHWADTEQVTLLLYSAQNVCILPIMLQIRANDSCCKEYARPLYGQNHVCTKCTNNASPLH